MALKNAFHKLINTSQSPFGDHCQSPLSLETIAMMCHKLKYPWRPLFLKCKREIYIGFNILLINS